jgi:hypothetical protein
VIDPIRRAERAARLLDDELIREAREHMRDSLTRAMWRRESLPSHEQMKLDAYVRHFGEFFAWFDRVIADGKLAEADLSEKSRLARLAERVQRKF